MKRGRGPIALLTDFGTRDWYVAAMKGVMLTRAPGIQLVDITHEVPAHDVPAGAFILAGAAPWFPPGTVFAAVVDPGVGSRRAVIAAQADGRYFVGPDNGLLGVCLGCSPRRRIVRVADPRDWLTPVSRTFHGRDVIAPVAAHLARGGSLRRLGPSLRQITPLPLPAVHRRGRRWRGEVVHLDAFGNLITNLPAPQAPEGGHPVRWTLRYRRRDIPVVSSYAAGRPRQLVALVGSLGFIELAVSQASAARALLAKRGEAVELVREG